jgi:hypothetical protein
MRTISKPLSACQAQTYHAKEFTAAEQNYWKQATPFRVLARQAGRTILPFSIVKPTVVGASSHVRSIVIGLVIPVPAAMLVFDQLRSNSRPRRSTEAPLFRGGAGKIH